MIELDHILKPFHSQAIRFFFSPQMFLANPCTHCTLHPLKLQIPFQKREHRRLGCVANISMIENTLWWKEHSRRKAVSLFWWILDNLRDKVLDTGLSKIFTFVLLFSKVNCKQRWEKEKVCVLWLWNKKYFLFVYLF